MQHQTRSDTMSQPMTLSQWNTRRAVSVPHALHSTQPIPLPLPAARPTWRFVTAPSAPAPITPLVAPAPSALGSARAGASWGWAEPVAPRAHREPRPASLAERKELPMARDLLRAMALAAAEAGESEATVWAEAARMWLAARHADDPRPPTPGASAPRPRHAESARERCWSAIDVVLRDLRAPLPRVA
jgi:hypothetical protein